jgi:hypothetical protein
MDYVSAPLPLHEIPEAFIAAVAEKINNRTVALVRCRQYANGFQEALHIGSGTLLYIDEDHYGVLTAYHVVEKLEGPCHIGLDILHSPSAFIIDKDYTRIIEIAKPESEHSGPDLAFILLPRADVETIKASTMSFHPITRDIFEREKISAIQDSGVWFLCGVPAEKTVEQGPWSHYQRVYAFQHYTLPGTIDPPYTQGRFDFAEMTIKYDDYEKAPKTFGGMSGGGLWQAAIEVLPDGKIQPLGIHLGGVIFYESELIDGIRKIKCHFRNSLRYVIDAISHLEPH